MLSVLKRYPQLIFFGMLTLFFTGPGQTFIVSLFVPHMRQSFQLSQSSIAMVYSVATLLTAFSVPSMGRLLDRWDLRHVTLLAAGIMALGLLCLGLSQALWMVFVGYFLIRTCGQGTLALISSTTMARYFGTLRGKALAWSALGYPLSEGLMPIVVSAVIASLGWRGGWVFLMGLTLLVYVPVALYLLQGFDSEEMQCKLQNVKCKMQNGERRFPATTVTEILRQPVFYLIVFSSVFPATFVTGLFFHQLALIAQKGWTQSDLTHAFILFAVCRATMALVTGQWVDKYSALKVFPYIFLPFTFALLAFRFGSDVSFLYIYLAGVGLCFGMSNVIIGAVWAEIYGTENLGTIRGITAGVMVVTSAVAPVLIGFAMDYGWGLNQVLNIGLLGCGISIATAILGTQNADLPSNQTS